MSRIKVIALSDLHGVLPKIVRKVDLCLIGGDISPLTIQFNMPRMSDWIFSEFTEWIKSIPAEKVILIAGNHDAWFERASESQIYLLEKESGLKYLKNESYTYFDDDAVEWSIFGTPYCHIFGSWPFMRSEEVLAEHFSKIPDTVDIILSHDPPYGIGLTDVILKGKYASLSKDPHCGNSVLSARLHNVDFKLMVFGHIHSGSHELTYYNKGVCANISLLDESYTEAYEPLYVELTK